MITVPVHTLAAAIAALSTLSGPGAAEEAGFNRCCDIFSHGFCMDLPGPNRVTRVDDGMSHILHAVTFAGAQEPALRIYEGNNPSVPEDPDAVLALLDADPVSGARGFYYERGKAGGRRLDFVMSTGLSWPAFLHVWADWRDEAELNRIENILSNVSTDRTELAWHPDCEARQHEFAQWPLRRRLD